MAQSADEAQIREVMSGLRGSLTRKLLNKPLIELTVSDLLTLAEEIAVQGAAVK